MCVAVWRTVAIQGVLLGPPTILYYLSSNRIIIILIINYCYTGAAIGDV